LSNRLLPVLDKTFSHFSAEQNGVARVSQIVDEREEFFIHGPGHPVQLALWACNKAVNRDLHLQFEFSHDSSSISILAGCATFSGEKNDPLVTDGQHGFMLGFGNTRANQIPAAVRQLKRLCAGSS
jgi:hypothetical protein